MSEELDQSQNDDKCPSCGGSNFVKGDVGPVRPTFRPQGLGMLGFGESVRARKCVDCGNIQLFAYEQTGVFDSRRSRPTQS
jgi:predicted nucleic-acid-binding Zn-ribbon protein